MKRPKNFDRPASDMTKLEAFALAAMQGLLASGMSPKVNPELLIDGAGRFAGALLTTLGEPPQPESEVEALLKRLADQAKLIEVLRRELLQAEREDRHLDQILDFDGETHDPQFQ